MYAAARLGGGRREVVEEEVGGGLVVLVNGAVSGLARSLLIGAAALQPQLQPAASTSRKRSPDTGTGRNGELKTTKQNNGNNIF